MHACMHMLQDLITLSLYRSSPPVAMITESTDTNITGVTTGEESMKTEVFCPAFFLPLPSLPYTHLHS